jgi:integrase
MQRVGRVWNDDCGSEVPLEQGLAPPTIEVTLLPVRAIYRQALERGEIAVNPCEKLRLPRSDRRRDRIADPLEGAALIAAVPVEDQPVWATAMYAGLRRGELQALKVCDVDLATGHTFAALMIAAGVNAKALQVYMGHANISITLDRYGHLMPGSEKEAAGLLDAYLEAQREAAEERARAAAVL